jgi:5-methylcytosine-specific restriction endonuclease McrA
MGHPKDNGKVGIGCKRKDFVNAPINPISPKQRKRQGSLNDKREIVLSIQEKVLGKRFCLATLGHPDWKHKCPSLLGRFYKFVLDHVNTRNKADADKFENLQGLCSWCNWMKGSLRIDFRPPELKEALKKMDSGEALSARKDGTE